MYGKNEECCICGNNLQQPSEIEENIFPILVCSCAICGKFKTDTLPFNNTMKNMLASYLFYNIKLSKTEFGSFQKPFLIITEENIDKLKKEYLKRHIILMTNDVERWYPQTDEEKIDKILVGLSRRFPEEYGRFMLTTEELYSAFFVKRYSSSKVSDDELQKQVEDVYNRLDDLGLIAERMGSFAERKILNQHNIPISWEGQKRIKSLKNDL